MTMYRMYQLFIQLGNTIVDHFVGMHKSVRETHFLLYVDELVFKQLCEKNNLGVTEVDEWLVEFIQTAPEDYLLNDYVACVIAAAQVRIAVELPYAEDSINAFNERMVEKFQYGDYSGMYANFYKPFQEKLWNDLRDFFEKEYGLILEIPKYDASNSSLRYVKYPRSQRIINVAGWNRVIREDVYSKYRINPKLSYEDFMKRVFPEFRRRKVILPKNVVNRPTYERLASRTLYFYLMSTRGWAPKFSQQLSSIVKNKASLRSTQEKRKEVNRDIGLTIKTHSNGSFKLYLNGSELDLNNYGLLDDIQKSERPIIFSYDTQYDEWVRQQGSFTLESFGVLLHSDHEKLSRMTSGFFFNERYETRAFMFLDVATPSIWKIGNLLGHSDSFKNPSGIELLGGMKVDRNAWLVTSPPIIEAETDEIYVDHISISIQNNKIDLGRMNLAVGAHTLQIPKNQLISIKLLEPKPATKKNKCGWNLSGNTKSWKPSSDGDETTLIGRKIIGIDIRCTGEKEPGTQFGQALRRIKPKVFSPYYKRLMEIANG